MRVIGNDIVDLSAVGSALHPRYRSRVFTEAERLWIGESEQRLWGCWAAKEAAYKAQRQLDPSAIFAHRLFEYHPGESVVRYQQRTLRCEWVIDCEVAHAICYATEGAAAAVIAEYRSITDGQSPQCAVRLLAQELVAQRLNCAVQQVFVSLPGGPRTPPSLTAGTPPQQIPVSFSHDGRFISVAALI